MPALRFMFCEVPFQHGGKTLLLSGFTLSLFPPLVSTWELGRSRCSSRDCLTSSASPSQQIPERTENRWRRLLHQINLKTAASPGARRPKVEHANSIFRPSSSSSWCSSSCSCSVSSRWMWCAVQRQEKMEICNNHEIFFCVAVSMFFFYSHSKIINIK